MVLVYLPLYLAHCALKLSKIKTPLRGAFILVGYCRISSIFFSSASLLSGLEGAGRGASAERGRSRIRRRAARRRSSRGGMAEVAVRSAGAGEAITIKRSTSAWVFRSCLERLHIVAEHLEGEIHEHRLGMLLYLVRQLETLGARFGDALGIMLAHQRKHARQDRPRSLKEARARIPFYPFLRWSLGCIVAEPAKKSSPAPSMPRFSCIGRCFLFFATSDSWSISSGGRSRFPAGINRPMMTFSLRPRNLSILPSMAALTSTRDVSWNDAAERNDSAESAMRVMPRSTSSAFAGLLARLLDLFVHFKELRLLDDLAHHEVLRIAAVGDLHAREHLLDDHFDMLVVDAKHLPRDRSVCTSFTM